MARIGLKDLRHSYVAHPRGPDDYALKQIDLDWQDGGAYALLGPSGCGKSTLLNIISGLIVPSEGRILFDDRDVTRLAPTERNIAQVFQFPVIYDTMTVYDNLAFPLRNRGVAPAAVDARVRTIAEMLELDPMLDRRAAGLTADGKQKISMGRGLVREDVNVIMFDEPLTVIDPHLKWKLRSKLKELHQALRVTMIYVTHDQTEALTFADQVVVMQEGEVVQIGSPVDLFERPAHTFVGHFIGSPGMNILPCKIEDGTAIFAGRRIATVNRATGAGRPEIGVRPEFVSLGRRRHPGRGDPRRRRRPPPRRPGRGRRPADQRAPARGRAGRARPGASRLRARADPHLRGRLAGGRTAMKTENQWAWLFVIPVVLLVAFNALIPLMTVVNYSVQETFGNNVFFWHGVGWFEDVLRSPRFHAALGRQLLFTGIILLIEVPLGVAIALAMPRRGPWVSVCLVLMALPLLIPWNVVGAMWNIFALPDIGLLGYALNNWLGIDFNYTQQPFAAWFTIILMDVWHWTSLVVLLAYAGLVSIPDAYYQAAKIDGARPWAIFRYIQLPKMKRVLTIAVLLRFMDSFNIYTEISVLTGGGPGNSTTLLSIDLVKIALGQFDLGPAAAMSLIYFIITLLVSWVFYTVMTRDEPK